MNYPHDQGPRPNDRVVPKSPNDYIQDKIDDLTAERDKAVKQVKSLKSRLDTETTRAEVAEEEHGRLQASLSCPESYVGVVTEALEQSRDDWARRCKRLEVDRATQTARAERAERESRRLQVFIDSDLMKLANDSLREELTTETARADAAEKTIKARDREIDIHREERNELIRDKRDLEDHCDALQAVADKLTTTLLDVNVWISDRRTLKDLDRFVSDALAAKAESET